MNRAGIRYRSVFDDQPNAVVGSISLEKTNQIIEDAKMHQAAIVENATKEPQLIPLHLAIRRHHMKASENYGALQIEVKKKSPDSSVIKEHASGLYHELKGEVIMETNRSNKKSRKNNGPRKNTKAAINTVVHETVLDDGTNELRTTAPSESTKRSQSVSKMPRIRKPTHEDIAHRAYAIWNDRGRPDGTEYENWLMAERELLNEGR